ncbi:hypothetical protein EI94DRAFT_174144 [Lactarius quietus]|nr:hypothetical protein EI94DRAFT_174144 [Lactarius quietus]
MAGDFSIASRNPIPRPELRYDHQPGASRHVDPNQEPILGGTIAASPKVAACLPPFNPTPRGYPVPSHPLSSTPVNRSIVPNPRRTYQNEGKRRSTSRKLGQTYQGPPTLLSTSVGADKRHQCTKCNASYVRPSGLTRHYKDKHSAWMACPRCNSEFSLGRMYKFVEHLQSCPGA